MFEYINTYYTLKESLLTRFSGNSAVVVLQYLQLSKYDFHPTRSRFKSVVIPRVSPLQLHSFSNLQDITFSPNGKFRDD